MVKNRTDSESHYNYVDRIYMDLIDVHINGSRRQVPANQPVTELLAHLEIPAERVAIELNHAIVRKRDWAATVVPAGAQLEIVEFVGGG